VLDGVPQGMPALALADKLLGKAEKLGMEPPALTSTAGNRAVNGAESGAENSTDTGADTERELGDQLLAIVAAARAKGLDPERALRASLRTLQDQMRVAESL
jgi:XTP/dITP diphosphohydrolase